MRRVNVTVAVMMLSLAGLAACGSDEEGGDTAAASASQGPASGPYGGPGAAGGLDFTEVQACLEAAGLEDLLPTDLPTERPTGAPSDRPTDLPTEMPTDLPTDLPSGAPGGGGFAALQDPDVQAALDACGIALPTGPGPGTDPQGGDEGSSEDGS